MVVAQSESGGRRGGAMGDKALGRELIEVEVGFRGRVVMQARRGTGGRVLESVCPWG